MIYESNSKENKRKKEIKINIIEFKQMRDIKDDHPFNISKLDAQKVRIINILMKYERVMQNNNN